MKFSGQGTSYIKALSKHGFNWNVRCLIIIQSIRVQVLQKSNWEVRLELNGLLRNENALWEIQVKG